MRHGRESKEKIIVDKEYIKNLKKKAVFLDELLSLVEEKYFGYLMEDTEKEENISLAEAKNMLKYNDSFI